MNTSKCLTPPYLSIILCCKFKKLICRKETAPEYFAKSLKITQGHLK